MTDAPNSNIEFGRRKPCPRYIGPSFVSRPPPPPGRFPKEGPKPSLWSFQGGLGGNSKSPQNFSSGVWGEIRNPPRIFLRGSGGVFFQFGKNTSPAAAGPRPLAALPARRGREQKPPSILGTSALAGTAGPPSPSLGPPASSRLPTAPNYAIVNL